MERTSHVFSLVILFMCVAITADQDGDAVEGVVRGGRGLPPFFPRKVKCRLRNFPTCFLVSHFCPLECPQSCFMDCTLCKTVCNCNRPGAVCQDPRFVGGDGITFYFHGQKGRDFCLVTDANLHINAHFIGKRKPGMKRDFTWVQSLGILFDDHKFFIGAKKTAVWDDASDRLDISFDSELITLPLAEGAKWQSKSTPHVSISRTRETNAITLQVEGKLAITAVVVPITEKESKVHGYDMTPDDCFAHLDLGFKFYDLGDNVNGVLGQTYRKNYTSRAKLGVAMPVLGGDREFASSGLFSTDCGASQFTATGRSAGGRREHPSVLCRGGPAGHGVMCKS